MAAVAERVPTGAPSRLAQQWSQSNWKAVNKQVYRLQVRIAKAEREKRYGKVRALQGILTRSHVGRLWAVRRVMTNRGRNTGGVDGVVWKSPQDAAEGVRSLEHRGYRPQPLRRVYIPKSRGRWRPLGIPTMRDRAMQALHLLALNPVAETRADRNSHGFRMRRSTHDAVGECFINLAKGSSPQWVWDADIEACFDRISHDWLLRNIPMDKKVLRSWLKAGYVDRNVFHRTEEGTPQGGIVSPTLANLVLDGLEQTARAAVPGRIQGNTRSKVNVVRYADDLVITGVSKEILEERVVPAVRAFLAERGLEVSAAKTRLVHIDEGFNFLGFHFRKYRGKLLIQPMREKVLAFCRKIRGLVKAHVAAKTVDLVAALNRVLRGWANYYRHVVSKKTFAFVDRAVDAALRWWVRRRHGNRTWKWIRKRYYRRAGDQRWAFYALKERRDGRFQMVDLFKVSHIPIRRHVKIQGAANVYDPTWGSYFHRRKTARRRNRAEDRRHYATLGVAC